MVGQLGRVLELIQAGPFQAVIVVTATTSFIPDSCQISSQATPHFPPAEV